MSSDGKERLDQQLVYKRVSIYQEQEHKSALAIYKKMLE